MIPLMIAMQAAGMITDFISTREQIRQGRMGRKLEQAAFDSNLETLKLSAEQQSTAAMVNLRQTIGSQIAMQVARGTSTAAGSALMLTKESVSNYLKDERTRRINFLGKENQLRAENVLSGLHQMTSETKLGQALTKRFFDNLPGSALGNWMEGKVSAGGAGGAGASASTGGYGMTQYTG